VVSNGGFLGKDVIVPHEDIAQASAEGDVLRLSLDKGSSVIDRNGAEVGVVEDVRLEAGSDQLEGFDVRLGGPLRTLFPGGDVIHLGIELVDSVEPERVRLKVAKEALETKHY